MDHPIIFLDKDGTLIDDVPFNVDSERISLKPGVAQGLHRLYQAGYRFIIISNQSGVARGYFAEEALKNVEQRLDELFAQAAGVTLDGFYYCPHHPEGTIPRYAVQCSCRKPQPGLLLRAAQEKGIALEAAWMIGDILNDVEAGNRAGCRTILIDNGSETEWEPGPFRVPDFTAADLVEAAAFILSQPTLPAKENLPAHPVDLRAHNRSPREDHENTGQRP